MKNPAVGDRPVPLQSSHDTHFPGYFCLLLIFLLTFQTWHILSSNPRYYFDMLYYLATAGEVLVSLKSFLAGEVSLSNLISSLQSGSRPTLFYLPGIIVNLPFSFSPKLFICVTNIFYTLLFAAVIIIPRLKDGRKRGNLPAGLFFLISGGSLVYSRYPMVEYPLYVICAIAIILFLESDYLHKPLYSYLFLLTAAAGMLIKFSFLSFIIFPTFIMIISDFIVKIGGGLLKGKLKPEIILRIKQIIFFLAVFLPGVYLFAGWGYFIQNIDRILPTEVAGWWSYPYFTIYEKLWWIFISPTQILTIPMIILFILGLYSHGKKLLIPLVFAYLPLFQFGLFMQSKGARLFGAVVYPFCLIAGFGFEYLISKSPVIVRKKKYFFLGIFIVVNIYTSGILPLDFAPAYEFPDGASRDVYKGLTLNLVARGGFPKDFQKWEAARNQLAQVISGENNSKEISVVFFYYTPDFPPELIFPNPDIKVRQYVHELLWSEAQKFPAGLFWEGNTYFIKKTGKFTHWTQNGTGLEMERNLRFLKKQFDDENSPWRVKSTLVARIPLPDGSEAIMYKRNEELTRKEKMNLYSSYLDYDKYNGMNIGIAKELVRYYNAIGDEDDRDKWINWIKKAQINPKVVRLVSVKDQREFIETKNAILSGNYE